MNLMDFWNLLLKISLVIFMAGNLLDMGLRLNPRDALRGLKDVRFVLYTLIWGFLLVPGLAFIVSRIIPLDSEYATGLMLIGMAPCAPFLPMVVGKAKGDLGYTAAFMILASVGTVLFMPFAIPVLIQDLTVSAWVIARPLVMLVLIPLLAGVLLHETVSELASAIQPWVKRITGLATIILVVLCFVTYGKDMISLAGSYALASQFAFFVLTAVLTYLLSVGLSHDKRVVVSSGLTTRNIGAAIAPLLSATQENPRATVMVVLGIPVMMLISLLAVRVFNRSAARAAD